MSSILLIEDHPEIRENTAELLQLAGYTVYTSENGKEGIELARKHLPDLIVCDIMMPVLDGFGVLHVAQRDPALQGIPFIFLTAKSERIDFRKAMDLGADDFVSKPFTETELLTAIETRLNKAHVQEPQAGIPRLGASSGREEWGHKLFSIPQVKRFLLQKRSRLYQEGNLAQQIFRVEKGILKTFSTNSFGKSLISRVYFEGDILGLPDVLLKSTYRHSAEAVTDAEVSVLSEFDFTTYRDQQPREIEALAVFLAEDLLLKEEQLLDMAYTPMRERVENRVQALEDKLRSLNLLESSHYFTREELAQMAGTATESLIRVLGGKQ
jgi:CheY-like chemotaxis protein